MRGVVVSGRSVDEGDFSEERGAWVARHLCTYELRPASRAYLGRAALLESEHQLLGSPAGINPAAIYVVPADRTDTCRPG
jgi:hypothetical protein